MEYRPYDPPSFHDDHHPDLYHPHSMLPFRNDANPQQNYLLLDEHNHSHHNTRYPPPSYEDPRWQAPFEYPPWQSSSFPSPAPYPAPRLSPPPPPPRTVPSEQQHQAASRRLTLAGSLDPETGIFYRTPEHPRLRTAQACEKCRARKAKCTGDCPCGRCASRGLVCEYAKEGRVRGPNKPKSKMSSSSSSSTPTTSSFRRSAEADALPPQQHNYHSHSPSATSTSEEGKAATPPIEMRRPRLELDRWEGGSVYTGPNSAPPTTGRYELHLGGGYLPRDEHHFGSSPHTTTSDESPPTPASLMHFTREGEHVPFREDLYPSSSVSSVRDFPDDRYREYREDLGYRDDLGAVVNVNVNVGNVDHFSLGIDGFHGVGVGTGVGIVGDRIVGDMHEQQQVPLTVWEMRNKPH